jgi:hypothetical protein
MDQASKIVKKTFSHEQILAMDPDDLAKLLNQPGVEFHGTAVVRKADGTIRYDDGAVPGDYHESDKDMAKEQTDG